MTVRNFTIDKQNVKLDTTGFKHIVEECYERFLLKTGPRELITEDITGDVSIIVPIMAQDEWNKAFNIS